MAEVGTLTWVAEVQEVATSKREVETMSQGLEGAAEQARETDDALEQAGGSTENLGGQFGGLARQSGLLNGALGLVSSGLFLLLAQIGITQGQIGAFTGVVKRLTGWLVGSGSLSGALSSLGGQLASFGGWLAIGSAGTLAFAGAIGVVLGLIGVWILKITGVLDKFGELGRRLNSELPGWARDAILALISIFAGGLAVLGGMIIGLMEGDLDQAIQNAKQIIMGFQGAWQRLADGIWSLLVDWKGDIVSLAAIVGEEMAAAVTGAVTGLWNSIIPDSITLPAISVGGQTVSADIPYVGEVGGTLPQVSIGGDTLDLPQLATGGMVEQGGAAELHQGEMVLPADVSRDVISAIRRAGSGGGGETTTLNIEQQIIEIGDQSLDLSELSRQQLETLADLIGEKQGDELSTIIG